ncbi:MAG: flagellar hook-basal body complex protein FliE [Desulfovibrio sp.]|nr:flagellar hook-basal body complex protein FliE [Desulfovibrio sp.]
MSIQATGMRAYSEAMQHFSKVSGSLQQGSAVSGQTLFSRTLDQSLSRSQVDTGENFGAQIDKMQFPGTASTPITHENSFTGTLKDSLNKVNQLQGAKNQAINEFASGRTQNVQELMITMQKSSLAMKLTTAVRGKVLEAYKEISRIQF